MTQTQMTQPMPIEATAKLHVTLEAQQWNQVLATLNDAPYRIAFPLIQAIGQQLQEQTGSLSGVPGNGLDAHPQ